MLILQGKKLEEIGFEKQTLNEQLHLNPVIEANTIKGNIIYVDSYENVITNISEKLFREVGRGRKFVITFRSGYEIEAISQAYKDVDPGEKLALFGTSGNLEIAMNMGNASSLLGLRMRDSVRIDFDEK